MPSLKFRIDPRRRKFVRLIGRIRDELQRAFVEEQEAHGLTKSRLARRLGRDKGFITRKFNGTSNMTLETLADLAWALERQIVFRLATTEEILGYQPNDANDADAVFARLDEKPDENLARPNILNRRPAPEKRAKEMA